MTLSHSTCLAILTIAFAAVGSPAQSGQGATRRTHCDPVSSTSFSFGLTGGNLKPSGWHIAATGAVNPEGDGMSTSGRPRVVSARALRALARRAWSSGFTRLPTAPTHPTRNPDAAREFIEIHSACGMKHVEYASGDAAPAFRDLYARLEALTRPQ
jgi:hypothetical protein